MSIWEELGQKLTQSGQDVLQKARDISGVVTMNSDISDSKRKIRDLYAELGELFVSDAFADRTAADMREMISDESGDKGAHMITLENWKEICTKVMFIRSEEEVIAINEKKIEELKAARFCPKCGCRITKGMSFCPECGTRVAEAESAEKKEAEKEAEKGAGQADPETAENKEEKSEE